MVHDACACYDTVQMSMWWQDEPPPLARELVKEFCLLLYCIFSIVPLKQRSLCNDDTWYSCLALNNQVFSSSGNALTQTRVPARSSFVL